MKTRPRPKTTVGVPPGQIQVVSDSKTSLVSATRKYATRMYKVVSEHG